MILPNGEWVEWDGNDGRKQVSFNCLLERKITEATFDGSEEKLTLIFGNYGSLIFLKDREEKGESYIVHCEKYIDVI